MKQASFYRETKVISKYVWCHTKRFSIRKHMFLETINSIYKFANILGWPKSLFRFFRNIS